MRNKNLVFSITEESTFNEILLKINENGQGFVICVDKNNCLVGILTDGDLRRAILNSSDLNFEIINKNPIKSLSGKQFIFYKDLIEKNNLRALPIVNAKGELEDIITNDLFVKKNKNKVVIMAGGLGSRLGDLTKNTPKPMLLVGGKPILETIILNFKSHGFLNFTICINYLFEQIENYFKDGSSLGVNIDYIIENKRMGTAGSIAFIDKIEEQFFLVNGDLLTSVNFNDFLSSHLNSKADISVCLSKHKYQLPFALVQVEKTNKIVSIQEKPTFEYLINAGMYILEPHIIKLIPKNNYMDITTIIEEALNNNYLVNSFLYDGYWLDIGRKEELEKANNFPNF
jgi:dTDP-glucose pyrophosphorylase